MALSHADAARRMDAIYRYQRHIYDLTRKFYLIGRDRLLDLLPVTQGTTVLEVGCGTGRNLVRLARRRPGALLHGVDVAPVMIETAAASVARAGLARQIRLARAGAQGFDPASAFGRDGFDVVYFSYVLSMIPDWSTAVERALAWVKPGGVLAVVDFGDQQAAPVWRRVLLLRWLSLFDVHPRPEIEAGLKAVAARQGGALIEESVWNGYAWLTVIRKR